MINRQIDRLVFMALISFGMLGNAVAADDLVRIRYTDLDSNFSSLANRTVEFTAKLQYQFGGKYVNLLGIRRKLYFDTNTAVGKMIARDRDEKGKILESKQSNLRIRGRIISNRGRIRDEGKYIFFIDSLIKLGDDVDLFSDRLAAAVKENASDHNKLLSIVESAKDWNRRYPSVDLKAWLKGAEQQALDAWGKTIAKDNYTARIEHAKSYYSRLANSKLAIAAGEKIFTDLKDKDLKSKVTALLISWGAYRHRDRWVFEDDYYKEQGFIREGKEWIRLEEKEFRDVIQNDKSAGGTLFKPPSDALVARASRGEISRFMSPILIAGIRLNGKRLGMPSYVARKKVNLRGSEYSYTQWVFSDYRFYFRNGELMIWFEKEELPAAPEKGKLK